MRYRFWVIPALLVVLGSPVCARAQADFHVEEPIRLADAGYYRDGGTTVFTLVDAVGDTIRGGFDGRLFQQPWGCFVGALSPTAPTAKMLPLWGPSERALVAVLEGVLSDSLLPAEDLGGDFSLALGHLRRRVASRRLLYAALEQGYLSDAKAAMGCFDAGVPLALDSLSITAEGREIRIVIVDGSGKAIAFRVPASTQYIDGRYAPPQDSLVATPCGTQPERVALTFTGLALSRFGSAVDADALRLLVRTMEAQSGRIPYAAAK
jgi:hypothetical protein